MVTAKWPVPQIQGLSQGPVAFQAFQGRLITRSESLI